MALISYSWQRKPGGQNCERQVKANGQQDQRKSAPKKAKKHS